MMRSCKKEQLNVFCVVQKHLVDTSVTLCNQIKTVADIKTDINFLNEFLLSQMQWVQQYAAL